MPDNRYREELKQYIRVGIRYIRKQDILFVVLLFLTMAGTLSLAVIPLYRKYFGRMSVVSARLSAYNGYGRVYDLDGKLLYEGDIVNGVFTGLGRLYRQDGGLLYEGGFLNDDFSGDGSLFGPEGAALYTGQFELNAYHGYGTQYNEYGNIHYEGNFGWGQFNGAGRLYGANALLYEGTFLNGEFNGQGILYKSNAVLYKGEFLNGIYNGQGRLYKDEQLLYEGGFSNGICDGQGRLYRDEQLLYDGGFLNGLYSGYGEGYNSLGRLIYRGIFSGGKRHGLGELYNDIGNLIYKGLFLQDELDYVSLLGKHYDEIPAIFPGRSYMSGIYDTSALSDSPDSTFLSGDSPSSDAIEMPIKKSAAEKFFCEGYEGVKAALIFGDKGGAPDYAEAVIVWDLNSSSVYGNYINDWRSPPTWLDAFYNNKMCLIRVNRPERRLIIDYENNYSRTYWLETGASDAVFYIIEYMNEGNDFK